MYCPADCLADTQKGEIVLPGDSRYGEPTVVADELEWDAGGELCWTVENDASVAEVEDLAVADGKDAA